MRDLSILQPVLVQAGLTFVLLFWMGRLRVAAVRAGTVDAGAPGPRPDWPGRTGTISNAFHNQLETPMLFYAVVAFAMLAGSDAWPMTALAWVFVLFRIVHAIIHTTYNSVSHRFLTYLASCFALIAMWVNLALTVFLGGL